MNITIEQTSPSHIRAVHQMLDVVCQERRYMRHIHPPSLEQLQDKIIEALKHHAAHYVAMTQDADTNQPTVVGFCSIIPSKHEGFTHSGNLTLAVLPEYRSRGIGRKLLQAAINHAHDNQITRIQTELLASNIPSIRLPRILQLRPRRFQGARTLYRRQLRFNHFNGVNQVKSLNNLCSEI